MNLDAYLARIGFTGEAGPDLPTLRALHRLQPQAIPFENLSTLLGEPVPLEIAALEDKLVRRNRGGYCFEQNTLFRHALEAIGFIVVPLAARVVWNTDYENPRSHMLLLVALGGTDYISDVGFGGATLTAPLELAVDDDQGTPHETFRIRLAHGEYEVGVLLDEGWRPMYQFDLQAQRPIDYAALNHFVATHPDSHFRSRLMVGRATATGRLALADNRFVRYERGLPVAQQTIGTAEELARVLTADFGISLPDSDALEEVLARIARTETV
jgi:N-hydroxyarylamine O-acetyltransferase